jgi:hypothetical protein
VERRSAFRVVMVEREGKRQLERPEHKWEDYVKLGLIKWDWRE